MKLNITSSWYAKAIEIERDHPVVFVCSSRVTRPRRVVLSDFALMSAANLRGTWIRGTLMAVTP